MGNKSSEGFDATKINSAKTLLQEVFINHKRKEVRDFLKSKLLGKEQQVLSEVEELIWSLNLSEIQSHGNLKKKTKNAISSSYENYFKSSNDTQKTYDQVLIVELYHQLHILAQELGLSNKKQSQLQDSLLTLNFNNLPRFLNKTQLKSVDIFLKGIIGIDSLHHMLEELFSTLYPDILSHKELLTSMILNLEAEKIRMFDELTANDCNRILKFIDDNQTLISWNQWNTPIRENSQHQYSHSQLAEKNVAGRPNENIEESKSKANYQPEHSLFQPRSSTQEERSVHSQQVEEGKNKRENDQIQRQLNQKFANDYSHFKAKYKIIGNQTKYDLPDFVTIEKYAIMEETATRKVYEELNSLFSNNDFAAYSKTLYELIFYFLKRQQSLQKFIREIRQIDNGVTLKMILAGLFLNCKEELVFRLTQNLWTQNPVPFITHDMSESEPIQQFLPTFYYNFLIEETDMWVFSFGLGKAKGKSTFLNKIFYTNFEISNRGDKALFFNGTVDFQGDKNFASTSKRGFSLLDAHGNVEQHLIHRCIDLADFILIHVVLAEANTFGSHIESLKKYFPRKRFLVILRDFDLDIYLSFAESCKTEAIRFKLKEEISGIPNIDLIVVPRTSENFGDYENCIRSRILTIISEIQYQPKKEKLEEKYLSEGYDSKKVEVSMEFTRHLKISYESKSRIFSIYDDFCRWAKSSSKNDDDPHKLMKSQELQNEYRKKAKTLGTLLQIWHRLMKSTDFIFEYSLINRSITLESSKACSDLNLEKNEVFKQYQELLALPNKNENQINELKTKKEIIDDLLLKLDSKALSIEMIWREVALYVENNNNNEEKEFVYQYRNSIIRGEPFEILDGDNNYIYFEFLKKVMNCEKFSQKRILVISIIGPQNSGKSTLLNFLFGCLFNVSDGRCTRGVYGTLLKSSLPEYEYFLIIDSEGIQSIEKGDPEYDRKIILFCLAVSNIVIINVKDQITDAMKSMLEVCANALGQVKVNKMPLPSVYFVLNQKANLDIKNFQNDLQKIMVGLSQNDLLNVINISSDNFVALPSAFNQTHTPISLDGNGQTKILWRHFGTASDFIDNVSNFGNKILNEVQSDKFKDSPIKDMPSFINSAYSVYRTISKNAEIANFNSISEMKMQSLLDVWISNNLTSKFSEKVQAKKFEELKYCRSSLRESMIEDYLRSLTNNLKKQLDSELTKLRAPQYLRQRNELNLAMHLANIRNDWTKKAELLNFQQRIENASRNPHELLKTKIKEFLNSGRVFRKGEAEKEFKQIWNKIVNEITETFDKQKTEEHCCKIFHKVYRQLEPALHKGIENALKEKNFDGRDSKLLCHSPQKDYEKKDQILSKHPLSYKYLDNKRLIRLLNNVCAHLNAANFILKNQQIEYIEKIKQLEKIGCSLIEANHNQGLQITKSKQTYTYKDVQIWSLDRKPRVVNKNSLWQSFKSFVGFSSQSQKEDLTIYDSVYHFRRVLQYKLIEYVNFRRLKEDIKRIVHEKMPRSLGPLSIEVIQGLIDAIREGVIDICNRELESFDQSLSDIGISRIHNYVFSLLVEHEKKLIFSKVEDMKKRLCIEKRKHQKIFINMLIADSSDETVAETMANTYYNFLRKHHVDKLKSIFVSRIQAQLEKMRRSTLQAEYERRLDSYSNSELIEFLLRPDKLFAKKVAKIWDDDKEILIKDFNIKFQEGIRDFVDVKTIFDHIKQTILSYELQDYESFGLFECIGIPYGSSQDFAHCQAAFSFFFNLILRRNAQIIRIKDSILMPKFGMSSLDYNLNPVNLELLEKVFTRIQGSKVRNLKTFLESLVKKFREKTNEFASIRLSLEELDQERLIPTMLQRAKGCTSKCPCCNRLCDVEHFDLQGVPDSMTNLHKCTRHSIRAIKGVTILRTGEASVRFCEDASDDEQILIEGKRMKWSKFKKENWDWDWRFEHLHKDKKDEFRDSINRAWLRVGKDICDHYNREDKPMKYVEKNIIKKRVPIHIILALDGSDAMNGQPWNTLIESVQRFCARQNDCNGDFCTIIIFNEVARIYCERTPKDRINLSNLDSPSGEIKFTAAYDKIEEIMNKYLENQEDYFVVFLKNSKASQPMLVLNQTLDLKTWNAIALDIEEVTPIELWLRQIQGKHLDLQWIIDSYVLVSEKIG